MGQRRLHGRRAGGARRHQGDDSSFEQNVLEGLSARGQLGAYRHEGFWQPMDNIRDVRYLRSLWEAGGGSLEDMGVSRSGGRDMVRPLGHGDRGGRAPRRERCRAAPGGRRERRRARQGLDAAAETAPTSRGRTGRRRRPRHGPPWSLLSEHDIDTVVHLAAQTLVGPAVLDPVDTFRNQHRGHVEPPGRMPARRALSAASSSRRRTRPTATGPAPRTGGDGAPRPPSVRRLEGSRGHDRTGVCRHLSDARSR